MARVLAGAIGARSPYLDYGALPALGRERSPARRSFDGGKHLGAVDLRHRTAAFAGQHELALLVPGVAGKVGVAALETMDDPCRHERIDGPIDRDRRQPLAARRPSDPALRRRRSPDGRPPRSPGIPPRAAGSAAAPWPQTLFGPSPWPRRGNGRGCARVSERPCWGSIRSLLPYTTCWPETPPPPVQSNPKAKVGP